MRVWLLDAFGVQGLVGFKFTVLGFRLGCRFSIPDSPNECLASRASVL